EKLFGKPMRLAESPLEQFYMDVAASIQEVVEEVVITLVRVTKELTQKKKAVFAGGVMLNCKLNQKIVEEGIFENHYFYPCPGDAGSAVGSAYLAWHDFYRKENTGVLQDEVYLGHEVVDSGSDGIEELLNHFKIPFSFEENVYKTVASEIANGIIIGWFNGRMEFGPRALGNRSIVSDPRRAEMKNILNEKIKLREQFRPFAPAILENKANDYFHLHPTKYNTMMVTAASKEGAKKLMPAVIHEDGTARIQTVSANGNPEFYKLLESFYNLTGCPALINTSFNVRGEPIVSSVEDALRAFLYTDIDILVFGAKYIIRKDQNLEAAKILIQPKVYEDD
ncbi:MAG TPA: carbamoyltransferase C-terminal domain-containing protein, partial [Bacteroidia bacterium]|nr:carbamoyltransferase C-terminal domain-containing protein [Bacteroidia bacterium]